MKEHTLPRSASRALWLCASLWLAEAAPVAQLPDSGPAQGAPPTPSSPEPRAAERAGLAASAWDKVRESVSKVLELNRLKALLPEKAWIGLDQRDADRKIGELLEELSVALEVSSLTDGRRRYAELERQIADAQAQIAECGERALFAPEPSPFNPFKKSKKDFERELAELKHRVEKCEQAKLAILEQLRLEYERIGVRLTHAQLRFYLASVSGRDVIALSALFHNVRELNGLLEGLVRENPDNAELARRYYGLHVVLIKTLIHGHEMVLRNVERQYLPKVQELRAQVRQVVRETEALLARADAPARPMLEANRRAQETSAQVLDLYQTHLTDTQARVRQSLDEVQRRYLVAKNAYDTLQVASLLIDQMQTCVQDLALLQAMHLPQLLRLEGNPLEQKFNEITTRLN